MILRTHLSYRSWQNRQSEYQPEIGWTMFDIGIGLVCCNVYPYLVWHFPVKCMSLETEKLSIVVLMMIHYQLINRQLFEVFENVSNISLDKMSDYVKSATNICTFVYVLVGFFGYVAFSTKPFSGNILLNLSPSMGSDVIKIGFVLSVAFSFPLIIFPCR